MGDGSGLGETGLQRVDPVILLIDQRQRSAAGSVNILHAACGLSVGHIIAALDIKGVEACKRGYAVVSGGFQCADCDLGADPGIARHAGSTCGADQSVSRGIGRIERGCSFVGLFGVAGDLRG